MSSFDYSVRQGKFSGRDRLGNLEDWVSSLANASTVGATPPSRISIFGHSYAEGGGASKNAAANWGYGWAEIMGKLFRARVDNRAISGAAIASAYIAGQILQKLPLQSAVPTASPVQAAIVYGTINDMTSTAIMAEPSILAAYYYAFALRFRAIMGAGSQHASFSYATNGGASGWNSAAYTASIGNPIRGAQANLNQWTLTLPSTFPGGDLYIIGQIGNVANAGATHTITLDGSAYGTWDTRGATQAVYRPTVYKMAGLTAGTHTIVGTVGNLAAGSVEFIQGWLLDSPDPPPFVYGGDNRAPAYPGGAHTIVDADIATVNNAIKSVANNFSDGRVVYVDIDAALGGNAAYFDSVGYNGAANVHPNNLGHAITGKAFYDAMAAIPAQSAQNRALDLISPLEVILWPRLFTSTDPNDKPRIGTATLDGTGAATVTTRALLAESKVFLQPVTATGQCRVSAQVTSVTTTPGTFTITSSAGAADSAKTVNWMIFDTFA